MPAHEIRYEWAADGSLECLDYGVVVPSELVEQILAGGVGGQRVAMALGVTRSRGESIVRWLRVPQPITRSGGPSIRASVRGIRPADLRPDPMQIRARAREDFRAEAELAAKRDAQAIAFDGPACIVFVADSHIGGRGVDIDRAFEDAAIIRDTPGMFAVFAGDLVDNFVIGRMAQIRFSSRMAIPDEWALGQEYLRTFADKLVAVVGGNHDAWTARLTGVDAMLDIVPGDALYDPDEIRCALQVGDARPIETIIRHRWKGFSMYNPFHPHSRGARFEAPGYDLYVGAHTHTLGGYADIPIGGRVIGAVQCGTYKVFDPYQRSEGFPRTTHTAPVAVLLHEDGTWSGTSNLRAAARMLRYLDGHRTRRAA